MWLLPFTCSPSSLTLCNRTSRSPLMAINPAISLSFCSRNSWNIRSRNFNSSYRTLYIKWHEEPRVQHGKGTFPHNNVAQIFTIKWVNKVFFKAICDWLQNSDYFVMCITVPRNKSRLSLGSLVASGNLSSREPLGLNRVSYCGFQLNFSLLSKNC